MPSVRFAQPAAVCRRAFTLIEFLVGLAILAILLACLIPYVMALREDNKRIACMENLKLIRDGLNEYQRQHNSYPRTRFDPTNPTWTAYTGADDASPFAGDSAVKPNDVTASLWLLVRSGAVKDPKIFICPSTSQRADKLTDAGGKTVAKEQRGNFRSGNNLSYSFQSPFNVTIGENGWTDTLKGDVALLADKSPGVTGRRDDVTKPASKDPPELQAWANSNNHGKAGQNVLYADTSVRFERSAYRGSGFAGGNPEKKIPETPGDNIYTVLRRTPIPAGETPFADGNGFFARDIAPSWPSDSYLVPSDDAE